MSEGAAIKLAMVVSLVAGVLICPLALAESDYEWSIDLDCAECHAAQAMTMDVTDKAAVVTDGQKKDESKKDESKKDESKKDEAVLEMTGHEGYIASHVAFGWSCITCHEDSKELETAHKRLNSGKEATRLKRTAGSDELCRTCHETKELAKQTVDCKYLTDDNGTTVNPHSLPETSDHASISCMSCHQAHETKESLVQTARDVCANCHHANVYECGTCH